MVKQGRIWLEKAVRLMEHHYTSKHMSHTFVDYMTEVNFYCYKTFSKSPITTCRIKEQHYILESSRVIVRIDNGKEGGNEVTDIGPVELTEPTNFTELFHRFQPFHGRFQKQRCQDCFLPFSLKYQSLNLFNVMNNFNEPYNYLFYVCLKFSVFVLNCFISVLFYLSVTHVFQARISLLVGC